MQEQKSSAKESLEAQVDDAARFDKSLHELKDLCAQLHYAADHCETTFNNAKYKTAVVENTKDYVCKAVVTVIDHLGSISASLESWLSACDSLAETEIRIDSLRQRLVTCQRYSNSLALLKCCWSEDFPRYHPRYISPPISNSQREKGMQRTLSIPVSDKSKQVREFEAEAEMPLFLYTHHCKFSLVKDLTRDINKRKNDSHSAPVLPVRDGISILPKPQSNFLFQEPGKLKRNMIHGKLVQNKDLISFIRRGRKIST